MLSIHTHAAGGPILTVQTLTWEPGEVLVEGGTHSQPRPPATAAQQLVRAWRMWSAGTEHGLQEATHPCRGGAGPHPGSWQNKGNSG